jgi:hypothetical protein
MASDEDSSDADVAMPLSENDSEVEEVETIEAAGPADCQPLESNHNARQLPERETLDALLGSHQQHRGKVHRAGNTAIPTMFEDRMVRGSDNVRRNEPVGQWWRRSTIPPFPLRAFSRADYDDPETFPPVQSRFSTPAGYHNIGSIAGSPAMAPARFQAGNEHHQEQPLQHGPVYHNAFHNDQHPHALPGPHVGPQDPMTEMPMLRSPAHLDAGPQHRPPTRRGYPPGPPPGPAHYYHQQDQDQDESEPEQISHHPGHRQPDWLDALLEGHTDPSRRPDPRAITAAQEARSAHIREMRAFDVYRARLRLHGHNYTDAEARRLFRDRQMRERDLLAREEEEYLQWGIQQEMRERRAVEEQRRARRETERRKRHEDVSPLFRRRQRGNFGVGVGGGRVEVEQSPGRVRVRAATPAVGRRDGGGRGESGMKMEESPVFAPASVTLATPPSARLAAAPSVSTAVDGSFELSDVDMDGAPTNDANGAAEAAAIEGDHAA